MNFVLKLPWPDTGVSKIFDDRGDNWLTPLMDL